MCGLSNFGSEQLESLQLEQKTQLQKALPAAGRAEGVEGAAQGEGETAGTMGSSCSKGLGATGGAASEPDVPFRGSVEPLLGGQLIEAAALSLQSELLSRLMGALMGQSPGLGCPRHPPTQTPPGAIETGPLGRRLLPPSQNLGGGSSSPFQVRRLGLGFGVPRYSRPASLPAGQMSAQPRGCWDRRAGRRVPPSLLPPLCPAGLGAEHSPSSSLFRGGGS